MISETDLAQQIAHTLDESHLLVGRKIKGKVRDTYVTDDKVILVTSDRISAFDKVLTTIPFKGQVLNQMSAFWFEQTKDIMPNHVLAVPDPNVMVGRKVSILPIEIVVRGYLTGSAWRDYQKGNPISGVVLPSGMKKDQAFDDLLFTPSTKEQHGKHDEPISESEIVSRGLMDSEMLSSVKTYAFALFRRGQEIARRNGMILVDTKYEFGTDSDGQLVLADEMHTSDSSRYWYVDTYEERFKAGKDQRMLDKEFLRQWLIREKNFMGDGDIPDIPDSIRVQVAQKYIQAYEEITGQSFSGKVEDVSSRIASNLKEYI